MSFSYREERRGERVFDVLTDNARALRIVVSRLGAELISLRLGEGNETWRGFLHRDDDLAPPATGWANHATVMGYFLHRLKDGRSLYRGREIAGGTHSFLRGKEWRFNGSQTAEGRLIYEMRREDFTETEYPLAVSLTLTYALEGAAVRVTFAFTNHEPTLAAHIGFGLHPGFAISDWAGAHLEMPAGVYRRHFSPTNHLSGVTQTFHFGGGEMPFEREKLPGSFILELVDVPERIFKFCDLFSGRIVEFDFSDVPYLTLWSDGGPFLCVEPCWGLTDHEEQRAFEDKEGIHVICAGGEMERSFRMTPRIAVAKGKEK